MTSDDADESGFVELPVRQWPTCHEDPFDRLLIAQASAERLKWSTVDVALSRHSPSLVITVCAPAGESASRTPQPPVDTITSS